MRLEPRTIIETYKKTKSFAETSRILGIHKSTVLRWVRRSRSGWSNHLRVRVTRKKPIPKKVNYVLKGQTLLAVRTLREQTGWDARKIVHHLGLSVSHMAVYRYLRRAGYTRDIKNHRRPRFQDTTHMNVKNTTTVGYLQMDVKYVTPELSGLPWTCFEFAIIDIYSRYKDAIIFNQLDQDHAIKALGVMIKRLPFKPVFIQTDNGLEFQEKFRLFCKSRELEHHHIHKHTPNENAVIERSFRTDEEEFYTFQKTKPKDYDELQARLSQWLLWYNGTRPHFGINLKTPNQVVAEVVLH